MVKDNGYICFDHEESFRIKYLQFKHGLHFTMGFLQKDWKENMAFSCTTAQKKNFSINDFFSKCDQIRNFLMIWSHLLRNPSWNTSFFVQCAMCQTSDTATYHQVHSMQTLSLKNYVINEM